MFSMNIFILGSMDHDPKRVTILIEKDHDPKMDQELFGK